MKKFVLCLLILFSLCFGMAAVLAGGVVWPVAVDATNFPDENFRIFVNKNFAGNNNELSRSRESK